jgi:hypothetical protein
MLVNIPPPPLTETPPTLASKRKAAFVGLMTRVLGVKSGRLKLVVLFSEITIFEMDAYVRPGTVTHNWLAPAPPVIVACALAKWLKRKNPRKRLKHRSFRLRSGSGDIGIEANVTGILSF